MRITSKGQVTIPIEIREKMGFLPETEVKFKIAGNTVFSAKDPKATIGILKSSATAAVV